MNRSRENATGIVARTLTGVAAVCVAASALTAQAPSTLNAELERIFAREEYTPETFTQPAWIEGGVRYAAVEPSTSAPGAKDIVEYDTATGTRTVLVAATALKPAGSTAPLTVDDYAWSADRSKLLLFTNAKKVWRENTRGDYWVLDSRSRHAAQARRRRRAVVADVREVLARRQRVGYVRENNLYVEELGGGAITRLTKPTDRAPSSTARSTGSTKKSWICATASAGAPTARRIAYWQFDTAGRRDLHADQQHRLALSRR